jgi:4-hydroxy-2-oxoglutarate aldolase
MLIIFLFVNFRLDLPVDLAVELSKHPNIVGMKDSGGDVAKIGQIIAETGNNPDNFCMLAGSASFLLSALNVGAIGGICALANALPEECCMLQEHFGKVNIMM